MSSDDGRAGDRNGLSNKRRRIPVACSACRTRKSRCDGSRPKCSTCTELGFECTYVQSASSSNVIVGKEYLFVLETRLKAVEDDLRELKEGKENRPALTLEQRFKEQAKPPDLDDNGRSSQNHGHEGITIRDEDLQDSTGQEEATDGIGAAVFDEQDDTGFFGPSSHIAFTRHITCAVASVAQSSLPTIHGQENTQKPGPGFVSMSRPSSPAGGRRLILGNPSKNDMTDIYALPPDAETRGLLSQFFSNTGLLFPYIHEETFLQTYSDVKANNFTKVRRTWLGLLNIILALVTSATRHVNSSRDKRGESSDLFYKRAVGLCSKQIMCGTSLEAVQYLLVMSMYLQGTQKSIEAWQTHGLAVKAALQLGLHSSDASARFQPLEREIRKRTWFCCVLLDRTLSMTFGRPATIPDDYVRLELPLQYEKIIGTSGPVDIHKSTSVSFFTATITLYKLMWRIIHLAYGGNLGCSNQGSFVNTFTTLFELEEQMLNWERALPPRLMIFNPQDVAAQNRDPVLERFRVVITLRYHNLRILLHRPVLVRCLELFSHNNVDNQEVALLQRVGPSSFEICVSSSVEIIAIVHGILKSPEALRNRLGAWWFSLYYTFNAGLVIFACLLVLQQSHVMRPSLPVALETSRKYLTDAVEALQMLDRDNRSTQRCSKYLERLAQLLDSLTSSRTDNMPRPIFHFNASQAQSANIPQIFNVTSDNLFSMTTHQSDPFNLSHKDIEPGDFMANNDWAFMEGLFDPA